MGFNNRRALLASAGPAFLAVFRPLPSRGNGRVDYIWRSSRASTLSLQSAQVYDTGAISDHRPVSATAAIGDAPFTLPAEKNMRIIKQRGGS